LDYTHIPVELEQIVSAWIKVVFSIRVAIVKTT